MAYDQDAHRVYKDIPRRLLFSRFQGVSHRALFLPGKNCLDIKLGLEMGKLDRNNTEFHLFEKDKSIAKEIEKECRRIGLKKFTIYPFNLLSTKGISALHIGEEGDNPPGYDLAFFDFCGEMTQNVFDSLIDFSWQDSVMTGEDSPTAIAGFTFSTLFRYNDFWLRYKYYLRKDFKPPESAQYLRGNDMAYKADWTCFQALNALDYYDFKIATKEQIIDFVQYRDEGKNPMLFFSLDCTEGQVIAGSGCRKSAGKKAATTRKVNKLQREYDAAKSAGVKAAIRTKMNRLLAGSK